MNKIFCFVFLFVINLYAHPHTFIEVKPTIEIKGNQVVKINIHWTIDEMTSMMLIEELDVNNNGKFEKEENDYIYENYFLALDKYSFYMNLLSKNQKLSFIPKKFKASIENNRLIYYFVVDQKIDLDEFRINFFDELLYVGMIVKKEFISFKGIKLEETKMLKKQIFGVS